MEPSKKKLLFVSYHYPPISVSSGYQRTLAFSKYLKEFGWDTTILTASNKAYERWDSSNYKMIPPHVKVIKAFARDTQKHLAIKGKYFRFMSLPDKWQSWIFGGIISGLINIFRNRPDVIISTYPVASAHVIGYCLHRLTGIPWLADFRDPMAQDDYPKDPKVHKSFVNLEKKIFQYASKVIFVTEGARNYYLNRYPNIAPDKLVVIQNGYDEEVFSGLKPKGERKNGRSMPKKIIHSGIIYPNERDPRPLLVAISTLKKEKKLSSESLQVTLRASGHDHIFEPIVKELDIDDIVKFEPAIPYSEALTEMLESDGLLLLQADSCNDQIPAKAYEYIRAKRPVIALTAKNGETGKLIKGVNVGDVAELDNVAEIKALILDFMSGTYDFIPVSEEVVSSYSRKNRTAELDELMTALIKMP